MPTRSTRLFTAVPVASELLERRVSAQSGGSQHLHCLLLRKRTAVCLPENPVSFNTEIISFWAKTQPWSPSRLLCPKELLLFCRKFPAFHLFPTIPCCLTTWNSWQAACSVLLLVTWCTASLHFLLKKITVTEVKTAPLQGPTEMSQ